MRLPPVGYFLFGLVLGCEREPPVPKDTHVNESIVLAVGDPTDNFPKVDVTDLKLPQHLPRPHHSYLLPAGHTTPPVLLPLPSTPKVTFNIDQKVACVLALNGQVGCVSDSSSFQLEVPLPTKPVVDLCSAPPYLKRIFQDGSFDDQYKQQVGSTVVNDLQPALPLARFTADEYWALSPRGEIRPLASWNIIALNRPVLELAVVDNGSQYCALELDQSISCMSRFELTDISLLHLEGPYKQIASDMVDLYALDRDGRLRHIPFPDAVAPSPAPLGEEFLVIKGGYGTFCGIRPDHTIECWGRYFYEDGSLVDGCAGLAHPEGEYRDVYVRELSVCGWRLDSDEITCMHGSSCWTSLDQGMSPDLITDLYAEVRDLPPL